MGRKNRSNEEAKEPVDMTLLLPKLPKRYYWRITTRDRDKDYGIKLMRHSNWFGIGLQQGGTEWVSASKIEAEVDAIKTGKDIDSYYSLSYNLGSRVRQQIPESAWNGGSPRDPLDIAGKYYVRRVIDPEENLESRIS